MAKRVFAMRELVELIYDFSDQGREEHQAKYEEVCAWIIPYYSIQALEYEFYAEYYDMRMRKHGEKKAFIEFVNFRFKDEPWETPQSFAKRLLRCRCCSRHSHYKTLPYKPEHPVPESLCMDECMCNCRHLYRRFQDCGLV
jgi:hypothetical protein